MQHILTWLIKSVFRLAILSALCVYPLNADSDVDDDTAQGWSPSQANAWMNAQMNYAAAVKEYGENSPEATDAQVRRNTLARKLGIKASDEVPQQAESEPEIDYAQKEESEAADQVRRSPPLNAAAPLQISTSDTPPPPNPSEANQ